MDEAPAAATALDFVFVGGNGDGAPRSQGGGRRERLRFQVTVDAACGENPSDGDVAGRDFVQCRR
jgi:hypothetical protein